MDKGLWVAIIGATGIVFASLAGRPHKLKNERDSIRQDIEIYNMLPKASSARRKLLNRINESVVDFLVENRKVRRDIRGGIKSLIIAFLLSSVIGFMVYALWLTPKKNSFSGVDQIMLTFIMIIFSIFLIFFCIQASLELQKKLRDPDGSASDGSDDFGQS